MNLWKCAWRGCCSRPNKGKGEAGPDGLAPARGAHATFRRDSRIRERPVRLLARKTRAGAGRGIDPRAQLPPTQAGSAQGRGALLFGARRAAADAGYGGSGASVPARAEQGAVHGVPAAKAAQGSAGLSGRGHRAARASARVSPPVRRGRDRIHLPARHRARVCRAPVSRLQDPLRRAVSRHAQQQSLPARGGIAQHSRFGGHAAAPAPQGRRGAPGNRSGRRPRNHRAPALEFRAGRLAGISGARARQFVPAVQSLRSDAAPGSEISPVHAERAGHLARSAGAFQPSARARRAAASPVRFLFDGRALYRERRARSRRAFHQADALPHQRGFAHRARADGSGGARKKSPWSSN